MPNPEALPIPSRTDRAAPGRVAPSPPPGYPPARSEPLNIVPPVNRPPPETPATLGDLEQSEERLRDWFGRALTEETGAVQRAVVSEVRTLVAESEERTRALIAESEERTRAFVVETVRESEERTRAFVLETVRESEARMTRVIIESIRESEKRQDERLDARLAAFLTEVRTLIRDSEERTVARIRESEERTVARIRDSEERGGARMGRIARRYDILFATLFFSLLGAALTVFVRWYSGLF